MLKKERHINPILLILFLCVSTNSFCQSPTKNIAKSFDEIVGYDNLDISNGIFLPPDYPYLLDQENKYFENKTNTKTFNQTLLTTQNQNGYTKGNVTYNGQRYYDVELKYDILNDFLIYHPKGTSSIIACRLISQKVDSFSIYDKNFIHISKKNIAPAGTNFQGFYQKIVIDNDLELYLKFEKNRREQIKNHKIYYFYVSNHQFWINYDKIYTKITSKKDVLNIFPTLSKEIQNFYEVEALLKDNNLPLFYENLLFYIKDFLDN